MKFGVVNKLTILNRFVIHNLQRNITHLAVITRKTNIKLGILKGGNWQRAVFSIQAGQTECWWTQCLAVRVWQAQCVETTSRPSFSVSITLTRTKTRRKLTSSGTPPSSIRSLPMDIERNGRGEIVIITKPKRLVFRGSI